MTGRERVLAVLNKKIPDRIPTLEWVLSPKVMSGVARLSGFDGVIDDIA